MEAFFRDHPGVLNGIDADAIAVAQQQLEDAAARLSDHPQQRGDAGSDEPGHDLRVRRDGVLRRRRSSSAIRPSTRSYGTSPASEAELVYRKAKQVSSVTYNLFTIAKKMDSEPPVVWHVRAGRGAGERQERADQAVPDHGVAVRLDGLLRVRALPLGAQPGGVPGGPAAVRRSRAGGVGQLPGPLEGRRTAVRTTPPSTRSPTTC